MPSRGKPDPVIRALVVLLLTASLAAEPGITVLVDSRNKAHLQLAQQVRRYLHLLRKANDLEEFQLSIATADWSDPATAALWQRQFAVTGKELPALAVVRRQGNRFTVENLLRRFQSPQSAAQGAFKCLKAQSPQLVKEDELHTRLVLTSKPAGVGVFIDGEGSGTTPCKLDLKPGRHHLVLQQANFEPKSEIFTLEFGQTLNREVALQPQGAFLRVESPMSLEVTLDDGEAVTTPCLVDLPAGRHRYRARAVGHYPAEGEFEVVPDRLTSVSIVLAPLRLRVAVSNFEALGYTGYNTHSSGTGWRRTEWITPYEVYLDQNSLKQRLHQALSQGALDLVESQPDCVIAVEIHSSESQVTGLATLADAQGKVLHSLSALRDMPFVTFDEQGSAQKRAEEVLDDLLTQIAPRLSQIPLQTEHAPPDRQAQVKVEIGPPP